MPGDIKKQAYIMIRDMYIDGYTLREAANKVGISYSVVRRARLLLGRVYGRAHEVNRRRFRSTLFAATTAAPTPPQR